MATVTNKELFVGGFLRILKEQKQVDVLLKAKDSDENGSVISAHKLVLSARSQVFEKILESDEIKPSAELETITLSDMTHEELEAFIDFIYGDGSALSAKEKKHNNSLYLAADKYEIPHLRDLCRNELISSLSASNALNILELAQVPFDKVLNDAAFNSIITNMSTIANSDKFDLFVVSHPNLAAQIMKTFSRNGLCNRKSLCNTNRKSLCSKCRRYYDDSDEY